MGDAPPAILLLPERRLLAGEAAPAFARRMERGERTTGRAGLESQLQRHFAPEPSGCWPMAAIQREAEAADAGDAPWVFADPVHLRAEMTGARLLGWGNLSLEAGEADEFIDALSPGFAEFGIDIGRTRPAHWFLRLPSSLVPPPVAAPADALGEDLFAHLPSGEHGREWRRMQSDAQVVLHHHPCNASRVARGLPAVNGLWFWGGGQRPTRVASVAQGVVSTDPQLLALARAAGIDVGMAHAGALVDLRDARAWDDPRLVAATAMPAGHVGLDFADGEQIALRPRPAWRFWERD